MILRSIRIQLFAITFFYGLTVNSQISLVKNVGSGYWVSSASYPKFLTRLGNKVIFSAIDDQHGRELWSTDGTTAGTVLVSNINPEPGVGSEIFGSVELNGFIYFLATGEDDNKGLYKTDGTAQGTVFVKQFNTYDYNNSDQRILKVNNTLYFEANSELWKSDGTETGTITVRDSNNLIAGLPRNLTEVNGDIYFTAENGTARVLWKSDGTSMGTYQIDFNGANQGSIMNLVNFQGSLFFSNSSVTGNDLWKTDGTVAGTQLVSSTANVSIYDTGVLSVYNGYLYFYGGPYNNSEVWRSDGTTAGTVEFAALNASGSSEPGGFTVFNGELYFSAQYGAGRGLFKTNGVTTQTVHSGGTGGLDPKNFCVWNGIMYFQGRENLVGRELWKTTGTTAGTVRVKDMSPNNGDPYFITPVNATEVVFQGGNDASNIELWKSNGTETGTMMIKDIYSQWNSTTINEAIELNNKLFFGPGDGFMEVELWETNGTNSGTMQTKNICVASSNCSSWPYNFYKADSTTFYFPAISSSSGNTSFWKSNGTTAGTVQVKNISSVRKFIPYNGAHLFFIGHSTLSKTDGTTAGTINIKTGFTLLNESFVMLNGIAYFIGKHTSTGSYYGLWKTDGTATGTVLVKSLSNETANLFELNGMLYFRTYVTNVGNQLWTSDGTTAGTVFFTDLLNTSITSYPDIKEITHLNGKVCFTMKTETAGRELWVTDGTVLGTHILKDIKIGLSGSYPKNLTTLNGKLFFSADDGINGSELWVTDGTEIGTMIFKDIHPGIQSSAPLNFKVINGRLYFAANDGINGHELWVSDGSVCGTQLIQDANPGNMSSYPSVLGLINNEIILRLYHYDYGFELWKYTDNSQLFDTACTSYTWNLNNQTYTNSGVYSDTILSSLGCDSIVTLHLTISNPTNTIFVHTACDSYTWIDGITYTSSTNTPTFVVQNASICDSTFTLNLTITHSTTGTDFQTACDSYIWIDGNTYYSSTNTPTFALQNAMGCDSIVTLNLTITNTTTGIDIQTACDSLTWIDGNTYYSSTNTPTFVLQNAAGCDSLVTLDLTILSNSGIDTQTACDSLVWIDGITYYASISTPTFVLQNAAGCDSTVTLNCMIIHSTTGTDAQTACDSFDWIDGNTYTSSTNTPTVVLQNAAGCDSIITLDLTIIQSFPLVAENVFVFPSDANSCIGETVIDLSGNADFELDFDNGSQVITSSGYSLVTNLCPGVHDLHVTDNCGDTLSIPVVIPIDSNYVFNNPFIDSLAQDSLGVTMTNCDIYYAGIDTAYIDSIWAAGNTVNVIWNIVDSNGSNFDTTNYVLNNGNGVYWLQLSVFCPNKSLGEYFTVTEAVYFSNGSVSTAGLADIGTNLFEIYPNPTNDQVHISFSGSDAELTVYDLQGKVVLKDRIQNNGIVSLQNFERGVYLFDFKNSQGHCVERVVKQ